MNTLAAVVGYLFCGALAAVIIWIFSYGAWQCAKFAAEEIFERALYAARRQIGDEVLGASYWLSRSDDAVIALETVARNLHRGDRIDGGALREDYKSQFEKENAKKSA